MQRFKTVTILRSADADSPRASKALAEGELLLDVQGVNDDLRKQLHPTLKLSLSLKALLDTLLDHQSIFKAHSTHSRVRPDGQTR